MARVKRRSASGLSRTTFTVAADTLLMSGAVLQNSSGETSTFTPGWLRMVIHVPTVVVVAWIWLATSAWTRIVGMPSARKVISEESMPLARRTVWASA